MAALSITKLFLIPLEQTKRVQDSWQEQDLSEEKIETFQGLRVEDNFNLEVEQPKLAPPYQSQGIGSDYKVTSSK